MKMVKNGQKKSKNPKKFQNIYIFLTAEKNAIPLVFQY